MKFPSVRKTIRVWQRDRDVFLRLWKTEAGSILAEPLIALTALGFGLGAYVDQVDGVSYAKFVAPGIIASYAMFHGVFDTTFGAYLRMETHHIYQGILVTPVEVEDLITGEIVWAATRSLMASLTILLFAYALGMISGPTSLLIPLMGFATGLVFAAMGMIMVSVAPSINTLNNFFTLFIIPMFYVSGVFFPITKLPEILQIAAWILPLTPAAYVIRNLALGQLTIEVLYATLLVILMLLLLIPLATIRMRQRLIR